MTTSQTTTTTTTINYYNHTTLQHPGTCTRLRPPVSQITNHSIILGRVVFSGRIAALFRPHIPSLSHTTAAADVDASLKQTKSPYSTAAAETRAVCFATAGVLVLSVMSYRTNWSHRRVWNISLFVFLHLCTMITIQLRQSLTEGSWPGIENKHYVQ